MIEGTVKWFDNEKGYGFIAVDHGEDVFVHFSAIHATGYRSLDENERVEFEVAHSAHGPVAAAVHVLTAADGNVESSVPEPHRYHLGRAVGAFEFLDAEELAAYLAAVAVAPYEAKRFARTHDFLFVTAQDSALSAAADTVSLSETLTIPIDAYLDTDNFSQAYRVFEALDELATLLGYEPPTDQSLRPGSIIRSAKAKLRRGVTSQEARELLIKVERGIELVALDNKQADVDHKITKAARELIEALEHIPQACCRAGSLLLVKYIDPTGPVLVMRNMSQVEIKTLERFPEIQMNPRTAIAGLAAAMASLDDSTDEATA